MRWVHLNIGVVSHGEKHKITLVDVDDDEDDDVDSVDGDVDLNISVVPHSEKHQITLGAIGTSSTKPGDLAR